MAKAVITIFISLIALLSLAVYQKITFDDGKLHVIFCDVGQGDSILLRTPKGLNILIDGGPDTRVLNCLSSHTPFWDRTIELMILTHPHTDHFVGLMDVLKRYSVLYFGSEKLGSDSLAFQAMTTLVSKNKLIIRSLFANDTMHTNDGLRLRVLSPTARLLESTSPNGLIGESKEFASLITLVSFGSVNFLLTGDSQSPALQEAITDIGDLHIDVLQVPHHGSKTGLTREILDVIDAKLAVISVGKNNRYGHPAQDILKMLREKGIKISRTDEVGEVEIVSDGKKWSVKTKR